MPSFYLFVNVVEFKLVACLKAIIFKEGGGRVSFCCACTTVSKFKSST